MQALEDPVGAPFRLCSVCHKPLGEWARLKKRTGMGTGLHAPQPAQDIDRHDRDAGSGSDTGQGLFCAWFTVREAVAPDHNGNQAGDLRNRAGEQGLECGKAGVKG